MEVFVDGDVWERSFRCGLVIPAPSSLVGLLLVSISVLAALGSKISLEATQHLF